ncbi:hypothetical protein P029_04075 [Anaplasma phagocytophilum str. Norway variant2]|uniref:Uncharacterized protein n=1 Tax=Anaplasma phagocytophilum str. Norway variant2 TaxID=1392507 RepID=A0A168HFN3_ANAPH|nr:hypothetical protein P029_04075 [Anaplasma phagocytophilum str. Norway variant2]
MDYYHHKTQRKIYIILLVLTLNSPPYTKLSTHITHIEVSYSFVLVMICLVIYYPYVAWGGGEVRRGLQMVATTYDKTDQNLISHMIYLKKETDTITPRKIY